MKIKPSTLQIVFILSLTPISIPPSVHAGSYLSSFSHSQSYYDHKLIESIKLRKWAKYHSYLNHADVHAVDRYGRTALHYAAHFCLPEVVKDLLKKGADPLFEDNYGQNVISLANRSCRELINYYYRTKKPLENYPGLPPYPKDDLQYEVHKMIEFQNYEPRASQVLEILAEYMIER